MIIIQNKDRVVIGTGTTLPKALDAVRIPRTKYEYIRQKVSEHRKCTEIKYKQYFISKW